jgi:6-phospho-beta-glucosidase
MKSGARVAVIGGGSSYTPELIDGFLTHYSEMPVEKITLVDIPDGREKMRIVAELSQRMIAKAGLPIELNYSLQRQSALRDADFVCNQFRVGGLKARARDESIPMRYGAIGQETVGAGGFAKALRTIPVALEIARELEELNPSAWLLNFTNPSSMVTQALLNHSSIRTIGLCNVPINVQMAIAKAFNVRPQDVGMDFFGLNHLSFARKIFVNGKDVTEAVLNAESDESQTMKNIPQKEWGHQIISAIQMLPNSYLRYYWFTDEMLRHQQEDLDAGKGTRAIQVMALEAELFKKYQDPTLEVKPPELMKRGGAYYSEVAVSVMSSIFGNHPREMVVNLRNGHTLPELPEHASIEVSAIIDGQGARPIYSGSMPATFRSLIQQVKAYEDLTVAAAVTGDRDTAFAALLNNPLVPSADAAEKILDDILRENAAYLPQFDVGE